MRTLVIGLFMWSSFGLQAETEPLFLSQLPLSSARIDNIELPVAGPTTTNQTIMDEWVLQISTDQDKGTRVIDPGFEPTSEVMRETEAQHEAQDRLWQAFFDSF